MTCWKKSILGSLAKPAVLTALHTRRQCINSPQELQRSDAEQAGRYVATPGARTADDDRVSPPYVRLAHRPRMMALRRPCTGDISAPVACRAVARRTLWPRPCTGTARRRSLHRAPFHFVFGFSCFFCVVFFAGGAAGRRGRRRRHLPCRATEGTRLPGATSPRPASRPITRRAPRDSGGQKPGASRTHMARGRSESEPPAVSTHVST